MIEQLPRSRDIQRRASEQDRGPTGACPRLYRLSISGNASYGVVEGRSFFGSVVPKYFAIPFNAVADDVKGLIEHDPMPSGASVVVTGGPLPNHSVTIEYDGPSEYRLTMFIDGQNLAGGIRTVAKLTIEGVS